MFRALSLTAVCLILLPVTSAVAQKPFKNKTALAAKKAYEEAIAKAKKEYAAKLEIAIKEAGGAGDIDEATRLTAEKKRIDERDPLTVLRRRLTGTKWNSNPKNPKNWDRFEKDNVGTSFNGQRFVWFVTVKNTVVQQVVNQSLNVYVWHFDDELKRSSIHQFKKSNLIFPGRKIR